MNATNETTRSEAYETGYEAHEQGEPRNTVTSHYAAGSWDAEQWLAGWDDAAGE